MPMRKQGESVPVRLVLLPPSDERASGELGSRCPLMTEFQEAVLVTLARLENGEVVSYGWLAAEAGYPGRARAVGTMLAKHDGPLSWWRVVRADGRVVAPRSDEQIQALRAEGVVVVDRIVREPTPLVPWRRP